MVGSAGSGSNSGSDRSPQDPTQDVPSTFYIRNISEEADEIPNIKENLCENSESYVI